MAISLMLNVFVPGIPATALAEDRIVRTLMESISGYEIMSTVQDLDGFGSRAFYLDQAAEAADYIYQRFREIGLDVYYQNFSFAGYSSSNVLAQIPGRNADAGVLLFGAHYDSENSRAINLSLAQELTAPGADDDASGVAALIELAEKLSRLKMENTVKFVAFGAEEMGFDHSGGLRGSSHFADSERAAGADYLCAVILDMVGYAGTQGNHAVVVTNDDSLTFAQILANSVSSWEISLTIETHNDPSIMYSDHASFWSVGFPAVLVMEQLTESRYPINPYYHSSLDTSGFLSTSQMENVTRCLLAAALDTVGIAGNKGVTNALIAAALSATAVGTAVALIWHSLKHRGRDRK